jgi:Trk K+ transport system NAD-binding subunit
MDDLKRVAQEYLKSEVASVAVVSNAANESVLKELGLEIHEL